MLTGYMAQVWYVTIQQIQIKISYVGTSLPLFPVVLVSNNNIYIDIKLYFCFVYRSILKYRVIDVFGDRPSELSRKF